MSSNPDAQQFYGLQTIALEFRVTGSLDGSTISPPFALPPSPQAVTNKQNGVVGPFMVENLGLVDLTGGINGRGGSADRLVRSIIVVGPTPAGVGAEVGLSFDGQDANAAFVIPPGANGIASDNCIFVPQTAMLRMNGLDASPGNPVLVRILIWQPRTAEELAEMAQLCCCRASVIDEEGEPFFTTAIYSPAACARTVVSIAPPSVVRGSGPTSLTITGTLFADGDIVAIVHQNGLGLLNLSNVQVVNATTITLDADINDGIALGDYNVIVAPPLAPPQCQGIGEGIFEVT